ncbi:hypothetical protein C8F04DRAFT_1269385 [Mycena alexandri]|uniref:CxC2-like cysteine cluster KDZ transposase-associated domain-containing protein n=1 Tax=Mycena alexandri TaxID=1745969 RepID=A0AAD6SDJ7_9AGAR|nr:hypothetical protein C8F04DRAFT_1269385 [Mycena alexandri]
MNQKGHAGRSQIVGALEEEKEEKSGPNSEKADSAFLTGEFMKLLPYLASKVLALEADTAMGSPCPCGRTKAFVDEEGNAIEGEPFVCEVQCHNCVQYVASCKACFIDAHKTNPFHWAEVWDHDLGFFRRWGTTCNWGTTGSHVTVETGVHALRIHFCGDWPADSTDEVGDKVAQLLNAWLFPCTFTQTVSAITFNALKQFQLHHLESKVAAFDYCGSLRRLSDNAFTESVPNMYENFIRCSHFWGLLTTQIELGQAHRIDDVLLQRPVGHSRVECPSCPEPGFNMDPNMGPLPDNLKHLRQERMTLDGNFHCTKSTKKTNPGDRSFYNGTSFFPTDEELNEHLAEVTKDPPPKEVSNCNYLKAVNNQDKKKFTNKELSGIINLQCSHVFIKSSVDLQYGERYANVDLALARGIRQKLVAGHRGDFTFAFQDNDIDRVGSYDAACQYSVNVVKRFKKSFPDIAHIMEKMRWAVPALHIQGHQEDCMYKFATCLMLATGHFHGESAEYYWPELNQIGTQVTQMGGGRRQDVIAVNHNDWNYKKTAKAFTLLLADLIKSDSTFRRHQKHFLGLCATYTEPILREGWLDMRWTSEKTDNLKFTKSVYRHTNSKVNWLYTNVCWPTKRRFPIASYKNKVAAFLYAGIIIQEDQLKASKLAIRKSKHFSQALKNELDALREQLKKSIVQWQKTQKALTPEIERHLNAQTACLVEKELRGLPSELTDQERADLGMLHMVAPEVELRRGAIYNALTAVKLVTKSLQSLRDRKKKNDSGVYNNTISQKQINDTERRRDLHIARYMAARQALLKLTAASELSRTEADFPPLEVKDTVMKSRTLRRQLGDSATTEGRIHSGTVSVGARRVTAPTAAGLSAPTSTSSSSAGTVMVRRQHMVWGTQTAPTRKAAVLPKKKARDEGWLWTKRVGKMDEGELTTWMKEGDQIQWFHAEAEMERWREQVETILADWRTMIRSFAKYKETWTTLATMQDSNNIGRIAYAKQKAVIYARRESEGRRLLGEHKLLGPRYGCIADDHLDLVGFVTVNRKFDQEVGNLSDNT